MGPIVPGSTWRGVLDGQREYFSTLWILFGTPQDLAPRQTLGQFIVLLEMAGILQGKQPAGKVREALDGQGEGNIRYWLCIVSYEWLADKLLIFVLRTSRRQRLSEHANLRLLQGGSG
jgi:hypothetical protein